MVNPFLQGRIRKEEFHLLILELMLYHGRFQTYFRMSGEQFEVRLGMQTPHLRRRWTNY